MLRAALLSLLCMIVTGCNRPPAGPSVTKSHASSQPLSLAQNAAMEMALDAFQKGDPSIGWPADLRVADSATFSRLLVEKGYLSSVPDKLVWANVAEEDPLNTALARIVTNQNIRIVRKDGEIGEFSDESQAHAFSPPPPRNPAWLP